MEILEFLNQMTANPLLFVAVSLTLGVILVNGWTDAPNAVYRKQNARAACRLDYGEGSERMYR